MLFTSRSSRGTIGAARIVAHRKTCRFITSNREAASEMTAPKT
jgi:hypothetical protein